MKVKITKNIGPIGCVNNDSIGQFTQEKEISPEELIKMLNNPEDIINIEILC